MKWKALLVLLLLIPTVSAAYEVRTEGPALITVGQPAQIQVYITKTTAGVDSYSITPIVTDARDEFGNDVRHLVSVAIPSNRVNNVNQNETKATFATVTARGKFQTATIEFTIDPDAEAGTSTTTFQFRSGLPVSLPEFGVFGLLILMLFSLLLYKRNHSCFKA